MARFRDTLLRLLGSSSGETILKAAAAASGTLTFPAGTTDFSATGGSSQVVKQTGSGAAFTVGQLAQSDISGTLGADHGGTGVANNAASTITISGNFATTLTVSAATNSTLPAGTHTLAGLDVVQTWSAAQTHNSGTLKLAGATSGAITVNAAAVAGANTLTLPAGTTDFSATGGTSQVVKQTSSGGALTVAALTSDDLIAGSTPTAGKIPKLGATGAAPTQSGILDDGTTVTVSHSASFTSPALGAPAFAVGDGVIQQTSTATANGFTAIRQNGSIGSPTALASGDVIYNFRAFGYDGTAFISGACAAMKLLASEAWDSSKHGGRIAFFTIPTGGSSTQQELVRLEAGMQVNAASSVAPTGGDKGVGTINVATGYYINGSKVTDHEAFTVATLPTAVAGRVAYVTDGTASLAWGATVTGSGSTKYLVWYNGTNWTVMGK